MWNLTSYDVNRIKGQLQARRARIDAKYAEETKGLDADFADLDTLERVAAGLSLKYKSGDAADPSPMPESPLKGDLEQILGLSLVLPCQQERGPEQAARTGAHEVLERNPLVVDPHT